MRHMGSKDEGCVNIKQYENEVNKHFTVEV